MFVEFLPRSADATYFMKKHIEMQCIFSVERKRLDHFLNNKTAISVTLHIIIENFSLKAVCITFVNEQVMLERITSFSQVCISKGLATKIASLLLHFNSRDLCRSVCVISSFSYRASLTDFHRRWQSISNPNCHPIESTSRKEEHRES